MIRVMTPNRKKSRPITSPRREVYLTESAFLSLVVSAIEVTPKETYGVLLGYRERNRYIIDYAIPYQTAERHTSFVYRNEKAHEKMVRFLDELSKVRPIGDFHSHPNTYVKASKEDKQQMSFSEVYIIVGCSRKTREIPWNYNRDGTLSGTTSDFMIKICAYYPLNVERKTIRYAPVYCPFAIGYRKSLSGTID